MIAAVSTAEMIVSLKKTVVSEEKKHQKRRRINTGEEEEPEEDKTDKKKRDAEKEHIDSREAKQQQHELGRHRSEGRK